MANDPENTMEFKIDVEIKAAINKVKEFTKTIQDALNIETSDKGLKAGVEKFKIYTKDISKEATKLQNALVDEKTPEYIKKVGLEILDLTNQIREAEEAGKSTVDLEDKLKGRNRLLSSYVGKGYDKTGVSDALSKFLALYDDVEGKARGLLSINDANLQIEKQEAEEAERAAKAKQDAANAAAQQANSEGMANAEAKNAEETAKKQKDYQEQIGAEIDKNTQKQEDFTNAEKKGAEAAKQSAEEFSNAVKDTKTANIAVDLDADTSKMGIAELTRYIEQLKLKVKEIKTTWKETDFQSASRDAEYEKTVDKLNEAKQVMKDYGKEAGEANNKLSNAQVLNTINGTIQGIASAKTMLQGALNVINAIGPAAQTAGLISEAALTEATAGLNLVITIIAQVVNAIQNIGNVLQAIWNKAKQVFTAIYELVKKVIKAIGDLISKVRTGLKKALDSVGDSADKAFSVKNLRRTLQMLTKYIFGVRSFFFLYRKLRAGVTEGLKNLVQFQSASNETNHAITELRTSLLYLKNAWAAAFAPIINYVYPVLVKLMDMLASIGNAIARFIAALTGASTVLQAVKVDAGDYADSLASAGGSAKKAADEQKKLNDRLAAFDDLNVLGRDKDDEDTSPSGGGGGSADDLLDPNSMFERIQTPFNRLAQMLKDAWKSGDAFDLGDLFATNLEASLDKANKWLEGEGRAKILKIANLIGTFVDGVLSHEDLGAKLGEVIGRAFDLVCDTINTIITPARTMRFGTQVASAMNSAIPLIVPKLGETLGNLFRSAIAYFYGWVTTADWKGWGQAIADGFNNMLAQLSAVNIKGTMKSPQGLNGWDMLGISINDFAQGMIDMLGTAISQADWQSLGRGIGQLLSRIDFTGIWAGITGIWEGVQEGAKGIWSGFTGSAPREAVTALQPIATVLQNIPDLISEITWAIKEILPSFDEVMEWLQNLPDTIDRIVSVIEQLLPIVVAIAEKIGATIETVVDWSKKPLVGDIVRGAGAGAAIGGAVGGTPGAIIGGAVGSNVGAYLGFGGGVYQLIDAVDRAIGKNAELDTSIKGVTENIKGLGAVADNIKGDLVFDNVTNNLHAMTDATKGYLGEIPVKFTEIKGAADTQSLGIKDRFVSTFDTLKNGSIDSAKIIEENFTMASDNIKDSFIGAWEEIKKSISEGGEMFVALSDGMGNAVKSLLNGMIDGINMSITKPLQDISKSFNILRTLDVNGSRPFAGIPYLNVQPIPHLAQGAVIPPNKQFMAVLGDQTSGTNIEAPLDTIKQAVGEEFASYFEQMINATLQVVQAVNNKNLVIGDREIGKANARYVNQQKMIKGTML